MLYVLYTVFLQQSKWKERKCYYRNRPGWCGSVGGSVNPIAKGCGFDSWSERIPRLQVPSLG